MRKFTAAVSAFALVTSMTTAPAFAAVTVLDTVTADPVSQDTLDAMQAQCDDLADAADLDGVGIGDIYSGEYVLGAVTLADGPDEVGTHSILDAIDGTIVGVGFTPGTTVYGVLSKTGGSPNLFSDVTAQGGSYASSEYDFSADFDSTFAHAFTCNIYKAVFHAETNQNGHYEIDPDGHGGEEDAILAECNSYNKRGQRLPLPGYWGNSPQGNCIYVPGDSIPEFWDPPVLNGNVAGVPVDQDQTDTLLAHEDAGEGFSVEDDVSLGRMVVCISPSNTQTGKKGNPGVWRPQNGYGGGSLTGPEEGCNTPYFLIAPWGAGTTTSNTIYWSVPDLH